MLLSWASSRGINASLTLAIPFPDLGAGVVDTSTRVTAAAPTFTRATAAWTKLSTGLWASIATGTARSFYSGFNTAAGSYLGYLAEGARTNQCLQARDTSNASWTKVNMTGAKDQIGIDGVTNSASSLTATAINGSCLQTITEAATTSAFSVFIKRITGTGTVTIQQGVSTSEISASLNSSTYTRVELDASVLNPVIGIVLGTNGDKIAVDMQQFENGGFASTPIPTTTIAVARNADVLSYPVATWFNASAGTFFSTLTSAPDSATLAASQAILQVDDTTSNERTFLRRFTDATANFGVVDGGVTQASISQAVITASTAAKVCAAYASNDFAASLNGAAVGTDVAGTLPSPTVLNIGNNEASAGQLYGAISLVRYFSSRLPNAALQQLST